MNIFQHDPSIIIITINIVSILKIEIVKVPAFITYLPVLQAMLIALSAWLKPSADPIAILDICLFNSVAKSSTRPINY